MQLTADQHPASAVLVSWSGLLAISSGLVVLSFPNSASTSAMRLPAASPLSSALSSLCSSCFVTSRTLDSLSCTGCALPASGLATKLHSSPGSACTSEGCGSAACFLSFGARSGVGGLNSSTFFSFSNSFTNKASKTEMGTPEHPFLWRGGWQPAFRRSTSPCSSRTVLANQFTTAAGAMAAGARAWQGHSSGRRTKKATGAQTNSGMAKPLIT
mmetsp:Transcript_22603/g.71128  ORF Transcript_22603/g.71128 Transcript_22603/m.71128 type:complete len:214 (-) Transcript_22603:18-659(-)